MTKQPNRPTLQARWVIALAVVCGFALAQIPVQHPPSATQESALEWLENPRPLVQFTLFSHEGAITANSLRGHWQLLVLGFTHCPDLCPTTLTQLAKLQTQLPAGQVRVMFLSVDPQRDSPALLAQYVRFFGRDFIGVTGAQSQLRALANAIGMDFRVDGSKDAPQISHSPTIALIGPEGYLRGRLRPGFDVRQAARELSKRLKIGQSQTTIALRQNTP